MGLLDKAKAAAERAAAEAKKGAAQVQGKVEQAQTRKKADDLAQRLGYQVVRERQGQAPTEDKDQLVSDIIALEAQLEGMGAAPAAPGTDGAPQAPATAPEAPAAPPTSASEPTGGDFKLD